MATPEPPNDQSGRPPAATPEPAPPQPDDQQRRQPSISEQLNGPGRDEPPAVSPDVTQTIPPPAAGPPAPPQGPQATYPPLPSATASQPMRPVPPPATWPPQPYPGPSQGGPTASYPGMQPVQRPMQHTMPPGMMQPVPPAPARRQRSADAIPGGDIAAGVALVIAAGLAVGGSFFDLDHATERVLGDNGGAGQVISTTASSAWYYRQEIHGSAPFTFHLTQFFGVGLALGALLAVLTGALLLIGVGRSSTRLRGWGLAAATLLFGTLLTTAMSAVNDLQADSAETQATRHTAFGLGFWLLLGAGLVTVAAAALLVFGRPQRVEPVTPRYGIPAQPAPSGPQPGYHAPSHFSGGEHGQGSSNRA